MKQLWKVQCVSPSGAVSCLLFIEFMRLDSTLTGPGFTWCISSCDVVYRTLVLLSCCNVAVLYCYSVTVLQWLGESKEGECYRFHGVIPESEGSPTLPTLPDPQYLSTLTSPIISISILPCSVIISNSMLKNMYDASPDHKIKIMFKEL